MLEKITREVKHDALIMTAKGANQVDVAESLGISDRTIRRAKSKLRRYGDIEGGKKKPGRKQKITYPMEDVDSLFCNMLMLYSIL